jgi:hypothetical protein
MNLFEYFTTDNISGKKCTEKWLSKNNLELFNQIIDWCDRNSLKDLEFKRKVFHYVTDSTEIPVCLNCSREVKYRRLRDGYQPYCSSLCQNSCSIAKDNWLQSWKKGNSNNEHIVSRNKTVLEKYGNIEEYNKHIQNSIKETCLEKYGVEYATQTDFYKEKRKETLLEKYGSEKYNNSDKTRNTRIKNGTQINDEIIDGFIDDHHRSHFLKSYLEEVGRAKRSSAKLAGYFVWSLTDNFEWAEGFKQRFGLIHMDYTTQKRTVKNSGWWYKTFLEEQ